MSELETKGEEIRIIQSNFEEILELPEEEFEAAAQAFVEARLQELSYDSSPETQISALNGNHKGFIGTNTEVKPFATGTGFKIDDRAVYENLPGWVRKFSLQLHDKLGEEPNRLYMNAVLFAVQYAQQEYFGGKFASGDGQDRRESLVMRGAFIDDDHQEAASIQEFKGIAKCAERAAVANNMFRIFGIEPVLVLGKLKIGDEPDELHAYLVIKSHKGDEMIFDPTNPGKIFDEQGVLIATNPAFYPVESGFLDETDSSASVEHKTVSKLEGGQLDTKSQTYIFKNNPLESDYHPT